MQSKEFYIFGFVVSFVLSALFCIIVVFSINSITDKQIVKQGLMIANLHSKVDSLERVVNTEFKQKQDTIIVNIVPQSVYVNIK